MTTSQGLQLVFRETSGDLVRVHRFTRKEGISKWSTFDVGIARVLEPAVVIGCGDGAIYADERGRIMRRSIDIASRSAHVRSANAEIATEQHTVSVLLGREGEARTRVPDRVGWSAGGGR
ncbi:MAG: hypothetical protein U0414_39130 [Polyangiaceae bacterium]